MKNLIMIIAGAAALSCCVLSVIESQYTVAVLSLLSSFLPIAIWKWDDVENRKTKSNLKKEIQTQKEEIAELKKSTTWQEI